MEEQIEKIQSDIAQFQEQKNKVRNLLKKDLLDQSDSIQ